MSLCVHVGIQVGGLFTNGSKQYCVEPYVDRKVYSDFNTVFVPLLLLAAGVGFPAACL